MSRADIVYIVSRFPLTTETFIVRELDGLDGSGRFDLELRSLFPSPDTVVHDIARRWDERLIRPSAGQAVAGFGWAAVTRPRALAAVLAAVTAGYRRRPKLLARALATVPLACAHARDLSRRRHPPHIHAHFATYPALAAWVCARLIGTSYSFTAHAHDIYVDTSMLGRKIADARFVVTISEYNRELLGRHNPAHTPIHVVHMGIDTASYPFRPRGIPAEGPVRALVVASLQAYKGHAVLLEALAIGVRGRPDRAGHHRRRGAARRSRGAGRTPRAGAAGAVPRQPQRGRGPCGAGRGGPVRAAEHRRRRRPDGGLPVALMEALASGVPTVSTALSGIPELVVDGVTGLLSVPGDAADLNATLAAMLARGPATIDFAEAGRALVVNEFDVHQSASMLGDLLSAADRD